MPDLLQCGIELVERGLVPDVITRAAIRSLCRTRADLARETFVQEESDLFLESLQAAPIALFPEKANEQHYELPSEFFELMLGSRRKYSCCYFPTAATTLDAAEEAALSLTCEHADLHDGQSILELGCGWGSLSLWMAERYPLSRVLALSNSQPQRAFIEKQARLRSLTNLQVLTADINHFQTEETFDRVISVEMFEHLRNYQLVLRKIASWLNTGGKLLVHHFCHRSVAYPFEVEGAANWMGRYFFTGGLMPTADLLSRFTRDFTVTQQWNWNGMHYSRTADSWLVVLDQHRKPAIEILKKAYGQDATQWFHRWRMFHLAVSELFAFNRGEEWFVTHQLLEPIAVNSSIAFQIASH